MVFGSLSAVAAFTISRDIPAFLLTIAMREVYRRFAKRGLSLEGLALLLVAVSSVAGAALAFWSVFLQERLGVEFNDGLGILRDYEVWYFCTTICLGWSMLYFGIKELRESAERKVRLARAESERQQALLLMLRAQMSPHYLYNALNAIRAGVERGDENLAEVVQSLADYLQYSLRHGDDDFVSLGEEFEALTDYLKVEKARFRDDLVFDSQIDPALSDYQVPVLILQPLIENAIKHGRETSSVPLRVNVDVNRHKSGNVNIAIRNSGCWREHSGKEQSTGIGLTNLRNRLELLFPDHHMLTITKDPDAVQVNLRIPVG